MSKTGTERRKHYRLDASVELQGTAKQGGVPAKMVTSNLSMGGMYCTSAADFPEMTRLAVRLLLPSRQAGGDATELLDLDAVVVRRKELRMNSEPPRYELGLFFTNVSDDAREQLSRYLSATTA